MAKIRHACFLVSDLKIAKKFYKDILNLKPVVDRIEKGKKISELLGIVGEEFALRYVKLAGEGETVLELYQPLSCHISPQPSYFCHVAFTVLSIEDISTKLLKKYRKELISIPQIRGTNLVVMIRDLDGNLIELVEELK